MSKLELINIHIKNAKIKKELLKKICFYFSKDYTASLTAKHLELSRQTINHYYKIIRETLIYEQDKLILSFIKEDFKDNHIILKYVSINKQALFYIEYKEKIYFIQKDFLSPFNIEVFIPSELKNSLLRHKRASGAKISLNKDRKVALISRYFSSCNEELESFIYTHLKQFRGLRKDNFDTHIKESQFRFNYSERFIFNTLVNTFSL